MNVGLWERLVAADGAFLTIDDLGSDVGDLDE